MTDARIVTVLFTDLVGSTALQTQVGDEEGEVIRRTHFRLLREAVAATGGREVKNRGDGLMVVFPSAVDALRCAQRMQQAVDRHNRSGAEPPLRVRIGLNAGEPLRGEDDFFGTAVTVAARLCDAAEGGQIVVADVVKALATGRGGFEFRALGRFDLKGIGEPVPAVELQWAPVEDESSTVPLPAHLRVGDDVIFVGRERELEILREAWRRASSGDRRLVLVAGEPGIGKTRLMAELAAEVHAEGGTVLGGRSDEEGVLSYQPLVEAIRHYVSSAGTEPVRLALGGMARDLGRLLPELAETATEESWPREDAETERYRLFQAVASLLEEATRRGPLLLVIEDLHWSDRPTLALLRHLLRVLEGAPLLVCATYRDVELTRRHPLPKWLSSVRRELGYERIALRGLSVEGITTLLERFADHELDPGGQAFAEALLTNTEGNPFFVWEVLRHLVATGRIYEDADGRWTSDAASADELDIPEGVRDAVGRRLSRLSDAGDQALREASVLGRRFTVPVLQGLTTLPPDELLSALEEGSDVRLVSEDEEGRYEFTHALVRHTLYDELSTARRRRLHLKAAETIEGSGGDVREVAAHLRRAGGGSDPQKAIEYSLRAAEEAGAVFALEEANDHLAATLDLIDEHDADPAVRARVLAQLGNAIWYTSGSDAPRGVEYLEEALRLYEELGDDQRGALAHSALGRYRFLQPATVDIARADGHFRAAERALSARGPRPSLGYVYVGLAGVALWSMRTSEGIEWSRRALEVAEDLGSEGLWANAAIMHGWMTLASGSIGEGLHLFERAWETADRIDHIFAAFDAAWIGGFWLKELGDPRAGAEWHARELPSPRQTQATLHRGILRGQLAADLAESGDVEGAFAVLAEESPGLPVGESWVPAPAEWTGDWEAAEELWEESRRRSVRTGNRQDEHGACRHLGQIRHWRGDAAAALDALERARTLARSDPNVPWEIRACLMLVRVNCDLGRLSEAEGLLARAHELMGTNDWRGLAGHRLEAEGVLAAAQGKLDQAGRLFSEAVAVASAHSLAWLEAESYYQWGRAQAESEPREASERFDAAIDVYRRIGAGQAFIDRVEAARPR